MQDLLRAIGMYQDSVQQAATTNAINEASQFANEINANITDEAQKRNVLQDMGNQLAMRLVGTGANASHIQAAFQAVQPKQFATPEAAMQEGILTGNKGLQQLGSKASDIMFNKQLQQASIKDMLAQQQEERRFTREFMLQQLKSSKDKQITGDELKPITQADMNLDSIAAIKGLYSDWSVGPIAGRVPNAASRDQSVALETEILRMQDAYRSLITGAGAGDKELERLATRLPEMTDRPDVFKAKLQQFEIGMNRYKERSLKNLGFAGRDISGFQQAARAKMEQQRVEAMIAEGLKSINLGK